MTKEQTKNLFRRIKSHYQEFTVDDFKVDEWYKELKDYDYDDVTKRFELHLNSEDYGQVIPKLWFLKKGLITIGEKKESQQTGGLEMKDYYNAKDVQQITGASKSLAYEIIKKLQYKFAKKYPESIMIQGKIPRWFFEETMMNKKGGETDEKNKN